VIQIKILKKKYFQNIKQTTPTKTRQLFHQKPTPNEKDSKRWPYNSTK
jgi:hypothetical protein